MDAFLALLPACLLGAASSASEGLRKASALRPHLVVVELYLPGLDGFEFCRLLKDDPATRPTKILATAANPEPTAAERAIRCGADAFLTKPFSPEALEAKVKLLLNDSR